MIANKADAMVVVNEQAQRIAELETQLAEAHTLLDQDGVQIIRNHKDGYPEGRPNVEMTLVERVKAVCRMVHDWRRWHNDLEAKLVEARKDVAELESIANNALAGFRCTQTPADYPIDDWSNRLIRYNHSKRTPDLLNEKGQDDE